MFVFGAARAAAEGPEKCSSPADGCSPSFAFSGAAVADETPSFAFDASSLPAINRGDTAAAAEGFKFDAPARDLAAVATEREADDMPPLFRSTFISTPVRDLEEATVKESSEGEDERRSLFGSALRTKQDDATAGNNSEAKKAETDAPTAASLLLSSFISEEELMNSGHELHEIYTCPLCCLPIALPLGKNSMFKSCCSKIVCHGCILASHQRGMGERCAFCRTPTPDSDADTIVQVQERVDAKDPVAIDYLAHAYWKEDHGLQKDIPRAIELWTEAARLGDLDAHINLGTIYCYGRDVEQDKAKAVYYWQHAAIQGHPGSRFALGYHEGRNNMNHELAVQHFILSAKMGHSESLDVIKNMFMTGRATKVTKVRYAEALKGYQNAFEETKSPQREEAKAVY